MGPEADEQLGGQTVDEGSLPGDITRCLKSEKVVLVVLYMLGIMISFAFYYCTSKRLQLERTGKRCDSIPIEWRSG